jgi:hypothetical protein
MPFDPNDLAEMLLVKEHFIDERNFAMSMRDWPKVSVIRQKLKHVENRIASIRFQQKTA